jgi:hypothetical protein
VIHRPGQRRMARCLVGHLHNKPTIHRFLPSYPRACLRVYNLTQ